MNLKICSLADAVQNVISGQQTFMLVEITADTTLEEIGQADSFVTVAADPEPKPKPKPATQTPKPKAAVAPKVDHGRIVALYKAGWTIPRIADDVGCSQQTVYNHLQKEQSNGADPGSGDGA